jgi:hypothetical protein
MGDQRRANGDGDFRPDKVPIGTRTQGTKGALVHMHKHTVPVLSQTWRASVPDRSRASGKNTQL